MSGIEKMYCCPVCSGRFPESEMAAFREDGEWKPMCPECLDWTELKPIQDEGWYLETGYRKLVFLGTDEEVMRRLLAGECLGTYFDDDRKPCEITMRNILEYEMNDTYCIPARFREAYGDSFDWGKAWLDGRLTGYSPADYLADILHDEDTMEDGTLWGQMIYVGVKR